MRRFLLGFAALAMLAACSDSTSPSSAVGTYILESANGSDLPYLYDSDALGDYYVKSGVIVLRSDRSYDQTTTTRADYVAGTDRDILENTSGSWDRSSNDVLLVDDNDGSEVRGTLRNRVLSLDVNGFILVYRRQ